MPNFQYRAVDAQGNPKEGEMLAPDLSQLESRLREMGLWLVKALEIHTFTSQRSTKRGNVKSRDLMEFSTHMFTLLEANVPLAEALRNLSREATNHQMRSALQHIYHQVEAGSSLHAAMDQFSTIFPPQITNLIKAGEESDTLCQTFKELERYLDWVDQIRGEVRQATIYPSIVLLAVMGFLVLLFTFVIPRFVPILEDLNVPLPTVTIMVIGLSEFMAASWWAWILAFLLPLAFWRLGQNLSPHMVQWRDNSLLKLPILGEVIHMLTLSKFVQNFAVLYKAQIPVLQCLQLCRNLVDNVVVARALEATQRSVSEGATIHEALARHSVFPPMMIQMISVGEASGKLPQTLMNVANYYNREIPRRIKKIFSILEPVITLGLIAIVGFIAFALFMPMMSLMGGIG